MNLLLCKALQDQKNVKEHFFDPAKDMLHDRIYQLNYSV